MQKIHLYVLAISVAAIAALPVVDWSTLGGLPSDSIAAFVALVLLGLASQRFAIGYSGNDGGSNSIVFIPLLATVLLFGPAAPVLFIAVTGAIAETLWKSKGLLRAIFNTAQFTLSAAVAGLVYGFLGGGAAASQGVGSGVAFDLSVPAFLVFTITLLGLNYTFVSGALAITSEARFGQVLKKVLGKSGANAFYDVLLSPIAVVLAFFCAELGVAGLVMAIFPLWAVRHAYQTSYKLQQANEDLLEVLVKAIETRDPYTSGHSRRVQMLAKRIVAQLGLPDRRAEAVVQAAVLHDVGKIEAVYDEILKKPEDLTPEERVIIESHVTKGVELLTSLSTVPEEVISAVRHHHEREDGKGYPDGLTGAQIPLGAKVIKVCDAIDAMLSDRPYRKALPLPVVRNQLLKFRGLQFDAALVDLVLSSSVLEDHAADVRATEELGASPVVQNETDKSVMSA